MAENSSQNDQSFDLFDFFETLYDGKWTIILFTMVGVIIAGSIFLIKDSAPVYQSNIIVSEFSPPPFYQKNKILTDFQNKFFSFSAFNEWKKNNENISLTFNAISKTEDVDGFVMLKDIDKRLVTFKANNRDLYINLRSHKLNKIDELFKYSQFIHEKLKAEYINFSKEELKFIQRRDFSIPMARDIIRIERYIDSLEKGAKVFNIQRPSIPIKVSSNPTSKLAIFPLLALFIGVFFVFIRDTFRKRKEQLARK